MRMKTNETMTSRPNLRGVVEASAAVPARHRAPLTGGFRRYEPSEDEEYMSAGQLEHFRSILTAWKRELIEEVSRTVRHMQQQAACVPDMNDRASKEAEFDLELRARDRERKLLKKIDLALKRIDEGSYGYCEETGEEIGLRRLEARPIATICIEAQ